MRFTVLSLLLLAACAGGAEEDQRLRMASALTISPQGPSEVSLVGGPMRTVFGTTGPQP